MYEIRTFRSIMRISRVASPTHHFIVLSTQEE